MAPATAENANPTMPATSEPTNTEVRITKNEGSAMITEPICSSVWIIETASVIRQKMAFYLVVFATFFWRSSLTNVVAGGVVRAASLQFNACSIVPIANMHKQNKNS